MTQDRVVAIIQARMGSTRLPAKVMRGLAGRPMIDHVVRRTLQIEGVDEVVVATSTHEREQPLVDYLSSMREVEIFRGPEHDVLRRYYDAAVAFEAEAVMRITADCPLLSPTVSSRVLRAYLEGGGCDYATNTLERTYPRGMDTSVMSVEALKRAHREATTPGEREHVTVYIWSHPKRFDLVSVSDDVDRHHHRWTVDTSEDLRLVRNIYDALYKDGQLFEYDDVLKLLQDHPEWTRINDGIRQKSIWK